MSHRKVSAGLLSLLVLSGVARASEPVRVTTVSGRPASAESLAAASATPYWYFDATFMDVTAVVDEDKGAIVDRCLPGSGREEGGRIPNILGCFDRRDGSIHVRNDLSPALRKCVLRHERKHGEGFDHFGSASVDANFCGDGTK